jgi:hypothetical protein
MNQEFEIDAGGTRACASAMAATAARVTGGGTRTPVPVATPHWATSDAAALAADTARQRLTAVGAETAETARQIVAAVVDYETADDRAATRLRTTR